MNTIDLLLLLIAFVTICGSAAAGAAVAVWWMLNREMGHLREFIQEREKHHHTKHEITLKTSQHAHKRIDAHLSEHHGIVMPLRPGHI